MKSRPPSKCTVLVIRRHTFFYGIVMISRFRRRGLWVHQPKPHIHWQKRDWHSAIPFLPFRTLQPHILEIWQYKNTVHQVLNLEALVFPSKSKVLLYCKLPKSSGSPSMNAWIQPHAPCSINSSDKPSSIRLFSKPASDVLQAQTCAAVSRIASKSNKVLSVS